MVLAQSFVSNLFGSTLPVPSYDEWMLSQDMDPTYERYADNLRLIGATRKTLVVAQRSERARDRRVPRRVPGAPRGADTPRTGPCDGIGRQRAHGCAGHDGVRDGSVVIGSSGSGPKPPGARPRARVPPRRFFDVQYEALVRDPVATIREIYRWLDLDLTDALVTRMTQWLEENPSQKHGEHVYTPLDYGITPELIERYFGEVAP